MEMKLLKYGAAICFMFLASQGQANEYTAELTKLAKEKIATFAQSDYVVAAIKAQNAKTKDYDEAKIIELDKKWRAETDASDKPMINEVLGFPASQKLAEVQDASDGLYTEIFVMDAKGLNVAQSDATSDFWQGDEAKWQKTFLVGPDALHLSDVEEDASSQTFQSQVSMPITDPASGAVIGAITVGVNVELIE